MEEKELDGKSAVKTTFFILDPSAFILWKSVRTVGSLLGAPEKRNGNFLAACAVEELDPFRDLAYCAAVIASSHFSEG
jgi:hypothetical protein